MTTLTRRNRKGAKATSEVGPVSLSRVAAFPLKSKVRRVLFTMLTKSKVRIGDISFHNVDLDDPDTDRGQQPPSGIGLLRAAGTGEKHFSL